MKREELASAIKSLMEDRNWITNEDFDSVWCNRDKCVDWDDVNEALSSEGLQLVDHRRNKYDRVDQNGRTVKWPVYAVLPIGESLEEVFA